MAFDFIHEGSWQPRAGAQVNLAVAAATGLTVPTDTQAALVQAQGGAVRYRDDGTSPTGSEGAIIADGDSLFYTGDLDAIEFIQSAASGGTVTVLYYAWAD